jgi:Phytanoyl-CoA dioxygenase (PhyH).
MKWIEVNAGDVYVFNGAHVHAVEPNTSPKLRRTTLAGIFGFRDDTTVISWT